MHVFFSAGEPSGDQHAAHLIEEMRKRLPGLRTTGYGGPLMQQAGCDVHYRLTDLAVMFIFSVIPLLRTFYRLLKRAEQFFEDDTPDAVVLIDFPGFNWHVARKAKAAGIPVYYYMPPQLWAWAPWRIRKVRKFVDRILSGLPFEVDWYRERGVDCTFVGHPFFDDIADRELDRDLCERLASTGPVDASTRTIAKDDTPQTDSTPGTITVGLLPGSRDKEVQGNWPIVIDAVSRVAAAHPQARFACACFSDEHRDLCLQILADSGLNLPIEFYVGKTPEIIEAADCCLMVSGSVSLEMLARGTPAVVLYRISPLTWLLGRLLITIRWMSLPNLIAGRELLPEFVVCRKPHRRARQIAVALDRWLSDPAELARVRNELVELRAQTVVAGASGKAADTILAQCAEIEAVQRRAA